MMNSATMVSALGLHKSGEPVVAIDTPIDSTQHDAAYWRQRADYAVEESKKYTRMDDARYRQAIGPYYKLGWGGADDTHAGWYFKFVTDMLPTLTDGDLAFSVSTNNPETSGGHAKALQQWLNRTMIDADARTELEQVAETMLWSSGGVMMVYAEEVKGSQSSYYAAMGVQAPVMRCRLKALDRNLCFVDPDRSITEAEYMGHKETLMLADILAEAEGTEDAAGWDLDAVRELAKSEGEAEEARKEVFGDNKTKGYRSLEVVVYRIWCRRTQMIYTLSVRGGEMGGRMLKKPAPWLGHPRGPYVWFGLMWVRGHAYPASMLALAERQVRKHDQHRSKMDKDAAAAKKNVVVRGKNMLKAYKVARNGDAFLGDPQAVKEIANGGVQEADAAYVEYLEGELQELFGLSAARMGDTSKGPATNTMVAENALAGRRALFRSRWQACVKEMARRMAYLGWSLVQVEGQITVEDPMTGDPVPSRFIGGVMEGEQADWMDVESEIDLEPYAADGSDSGGEQQTLDIVARIMDEIVARITANPMAAKMVNWENWLDDRLRLAGVHGGAKRYMNWPLIRAYMDAVGPMAIAAVGGMIGGADATRSSGMPVQGQQQPANAMTAARSVGSSAGNLAQSMASGV